MPHFLLFCHWLKYSTCHIMGNLQAVQISKLPWKLFKIWILQKFQNFYKLWKLIEISMISNPIVKSSLLLVLVRRCNRWIANFTIDLTSWKSLRTLRLYNLMFLILTEHYKIRVHNQRSWEFRLKLMIIKLYACVQ